MKIQALRNIGLFESLSDAELDSLAPHFVTRKFPKNAVIITEGDDTNSLYVVLKGRVKVFLNDENGKEVILNDQGVSDYFGEVSLFDDGKRSASVMTLEPCEFAVLEKQAFVTCLAANPQLALTIIRGLTLRLRALSDNVRNLALMDVYGRVAHTLLEMAEDQDDRKVITERLTQTELAARVGASSKMVSRIMKELTAGGYIRKDGKQIVINKALPANW